MATDTKQVSIPEDLRTQGKSLSDDFQAEGLGTISHGDIYAAGLEAKRAILNSFRNAQKKGQLKGA